MLLKKVKLKGMLEHYQALDEAIRTAQFVTNKWVCYWIDNQGVGKEKLYLLCKELTKEYEFAGREYVNIDKNRYSRIYMQKLLTLVGTLVVLFTLIAPVGALEIADIPDLPTNDRTWVVDFADIISSATEGEISRKLDEIETKTGKATRFITVPRIDFGQPAQEFLQQVFDKWFPDRGEDQALVLIAAEDHRTAWQAGEAMQGILTPKILESVINETMLPPVQGARFNQALQEGAKRVLAVLAGEPDPGPPVVVAQVEKAPLEPVDRETSTTWVVFLLAGATIVPMATYFLMPRN